MSIESSLGSICSLSFSDCPIKLKKIIDNCNSPSEILDCFLKLLGDTSNEPLYIPIFELIPQICSDTLIQKAETEFMILSFQNIYRTNIFKSVDIECRLLELITTVLLSCELSNEVVNDVIEFLSTISEDETGHILTQLSSLDCLLEIELNIPGVLKEKIDSFSAYLIHNHHLKNKASEITSLILKNSALSEEDFSQTKSLDEALQDLLEVLPLLSPFAIASVSKNTLDLGNGVEFKENLKKCLDQLSEKYRYTFDLCVLQTICLFQERIDETTFENAVLISSIHPALPVGRNLIALDWLASSSSFKSQLTRAESFEPTFFDGADARLKKIILLSYITSQQSGDMSSVCQHLEKLIVFGIKSATSRSFAAVFRVMRHMVAALLPSEPITIVVSYTVKLGTRHPACLPHIVDFLKHLGTHRPDQSSKIISLGLVDAFDDVDSKNIAPHLEQLIEFFTESTSYPYEFCQPRMILRVIRNCLIDRSTKITKCGAGLLELFQALIRNQDYEIFQPELKAVLSLVESSYEESDIKQRAWMLRSLITHVNTDSLKDAFDVDIDLSYTGKILNTDFPPISINVLFDYNLADTMSANWSLERKRSPNTFFFPLEISLTENKKTLDCEYFGILVDFMVDPKWGHAESLYIPVLEKNQVKKECLQIQPVFCSPIEIEPRVIMSTSDGRIYVSQLESIFLKLEHLLSPLSSNKAFCDLWDQLASHSEKSCSSVMLLLQPNKLFEAVERGALEKFQMDKKKPTELAMVTPDSFLVLVRLLSVKNSWHAEILLEDPSVLPVINSFLAEHSC